MKAVLQDVKNHLELFPEDAEDILKIVSESLENYRTRVASQTTRLADMALLYLVTPASAKKSQIEELAPYMLHQFPNGFDNISPREKSIKEIFVKKVEEAGVGFPFEWLESQFGQEAIVWMKTYINPLLTSNAIGVDKL